MLAPAPRKAVNEDGEPSAQGPNLAAQSRRDSLNDTELFNLVYCQMRSLAGADRDFDDLVQIAAESAFRRLPYFEGRSLLSTWTYRICYNTWLKQRRFYRRWLVRFSLTDDGSLPALPGNDPFGEMAIEQTERLAALHAAIARIPERRRAVVILHDLEGHCIEEIASIVGANPRTVRSRLRDGRKVLLRELQSDAYFGQSSCERESS